MCTRSPARSIRGARVVYVDLDPVAVGQSKSILGDDPNSYVLQANLLDAAGVVGDDAVRALIDFARPVCLLVVAVGHFIADDAAFGGAIAELPRRAPVRQLHHPVARHAGEADRGER